jgi:hypothetical protein
VTIRPARTIHATAIATDAQFAKEFEHRLHHPQTHCRAKLMAVTTQRVSKCLPEKFLLRWKLQLPLNRLETRLVAQWVEERGDLQLD